MPSSTPNRPIKITRGGSPVRIQKRVQLKDGKEYATWELFWRAEGKRHSTSRANKEDAHALADEIATRLGKGEIRQRILTGLQLAEYEKSLEISTAAGGTLLDAARFFSNEWKKRQILEITGPDLVAEFLKAKQEDNLSKRYLDDSRLRLKKFAKKFKGHIQLIGSRDLDDYLRGLKVSIRSRDNVHKIVKALFSYARARGYLPASERTAAEILTRTKSKPSVIGILTPEDFTAALKFATPKTLPAFVLGGFCGMRQAEICRLDWSAIDFKRHLITVNAAIAKTSRRRLVPLHDAAAAWLAPIAKASGPVIEYSSPVNLSIMMRPVWKAADAKRSQNCLRHSGASYRLAATGNAPQTALDLGTSVQMLMQHYRELVTKEDAEKWFAIFPSQPAQQEPPPSLMHSPSNHPNPTQTHETTHPPTSVHETPNAPYHYPEATRVSGPAQECQPRDSAGYRAGRILRPSPRRNPQPRLGGHRFRQ